MRDRSCLEPIKGWGSAPSAIPDADHCGPDFEIVIILAPPRSFAALISAMLGQHPQLYGLPETHFFTCDSIDEWAWMYRGTDRMNDALRAIAQLIFGEQTKPAVCLARQWLQARAYFTTADVLRLLAQRVTPKILVEKTPRAAQQLEAMQRMLRDFPQARFLHLARHPHDQVKSRLERRLSLQRDGGPKSLQEAAQVLGGDPAHLWFATHEVILRFLQDVPPRQQFFIRSEDILSAPERHLREMARWLGIRADEEAIGAMTHPERSAFAKKDRQNAFRGGGEKLFGDPALRSNLRQQPALDAPLPWRSDGTLFSEEIRRLASSFGYT
jgi:Sulfotransferase family